MAAWHVKNIPVWERVVRVILGLTGSVAALLFIPGVFGWGASVAVAGFAMTGLLGYCPMRGMWGRKPLE